MSVAQVINIARQQIGKPYVFGTAGPNQFDCSGLVVYAGWLGDKKRLPHYTVTLLTVGSEVSKAQLQPGDLIFPSADHVQIYSGNGMIIEAAQPGTPVREVKMWGFWRARRVFSNDGASVPSSGGTVETVGNPLVPDSVERLIDYFTDPMRWRNIAFFIGGALLIIIGAVAMSTGSIGEAVKSVKNV